MLGSNEEVYCCFSSYQSALCREDYAGPLVSNQPTTCPYRPSQHRHLQTVSVIYIFSPVSVLCFLTGRRANASIPLISCRGGIPWLCIYLSIFHWSSLNLPYISTYSLISFALHSLSIYHGRRVMKIISLFECCRVRWIWVHCVYVYYIGGITFFLALFLLFIPHVSHSCADKPEYRGLHIFVHFWLTQVLLGGILVYLLFSVVLLCVFKWLLCLYLFNYLPWPPCRSLLS